MIIELQAKPGRRDDLKRALEDLIAAQGPGQDGFLGSTRYGVLGDPDVLVEIADWESAEAREAHMKEAAATGAHRCSSCWPPRSESPSSASSHDGRGVAYTYGGSMPKIVITHAVEDVERWLKGKAERAAALPGARNVTDLVAMDGSNHAAVVFDIDDPDALMAVLSSIPPEMAAQAESHGVIMPMTVYVEA